MFDAMEAFTKQFEPTENGYVYYPSRKSGGKLVTTDVYTKLLDNWQCIAGRGGRWKSVGVLVIAVVGWMIASDVLALAEWADPIATMTIALAFSAWIIWASLAPRRLVRGRPDIAPQRSDERAKRQVRAMLTWPLVIFGLLFSGTVFFGVLSSFDRTLSGWVWLVGSGALLSWYIWTTLQKARDSRS